MIKVVKTSFGDVAVMQSEEEELFLCLSGDDMWACGTGDYWSVAEGSSFGPPAPEDQEQAKAEAFMEAIEIRKVAALGQSKSIKQRGRL